MKRRQWWPEVLELAEGQGGMFTAAQARRVGASRPQLARLVESGRAERVRHGVYRLAGVPLESRQQVRASWMATDPERSTAERLADPAGPGAVITGRSAAVLLGLGDLDADVLEMSTPVRRFSRDPDVRLRTAAVPREDWTIHDGLPVSTPEATLARLATDHVDLEHLGAVARDAALRLDVDVDEIARRVRPSMGRYGFDDVERMLEQMLVPLGAPTPAVDIAAILARSDRDAVLASSRRMIEALAAEGSAGRPAS